MVYIVTFSSFLYLTCIMFQQCLLLKLSTNGLAPLMWSSQQYSCQVASCLALKETLYLQNLAHF